MDPNEEVEILVLRCQIGDREAFEKLFNNFQPRLRYYVRRLDEKSMDHDDMLQDVWLNVLRNISKLKEPRAFTVWLYKIARNKVYQRFKKKQDLIQINEEKLESEITEDDPEFAAEETKQIHRALNNINPQHREVLTLFFLERLPYQAIAEIVGCNIGTIKSRLYYAKKSLRKEMENKNE